MNDDEDIVIFVQARVTPDGEIEVRRSVVNDEDDEWTTLGTVVQEGD